MWKSAMKKQILLAVFAGIGLLTFSSLPALAEENLGSLFIEFVTPQVEASTLNEWKKDLFETNELWVIENRNDFFNLLKKSGLSEDLYNQLTSKMRIHLSMDESVKVSPFYSLQHSSGFLFLPAELKSQLPLRVLQAVYTYLIQTKHAPPNVTFSSLDEALAYFEKFGYRDQSLLEIQKAVLKIDGHFHFFYNRDNWSGLRDELKTHLIRVYAGSFDSRSGLQAELIFTANDDIAEIAERYAGNRDPKGLERYLRFLLSRSPRGEVIIPLSKILQPFIRKNINTHAVRSGANCFNSGVCVNEGNSYQQKLTDEAELFDTTFRKYRFVHANEQLQSGDLLVYRNANGNVIHVSTYVAQEIVYTKNGFSKFNPYIFQSRTQNEALYFPNDQFNLMVFRIPKKGESLADPTHKVYYVDKVGLKNKCESVFL